jgi:hypothetical protein
VLYFDNLSRDTADAYLAEGLTEEMIARLGLIDRWTVKSRTTVQRYRRALVLDRRNDEAWQLYGITARGYGEDSVSRAALQQALVLEPLRPAPGIP